ncbi:lipopolysaccharide biosynthesis protein [Planomonospora sphaerica]|uniref:Lipopolysaccharide biosynthesis protein n=1 Tax=Planomonospora sphaerica TaxID=161355 RepID=A0A171BKC0_9ACTN|nr:Wzz/FepE/Etk N-terminal domain-containing protein [Planomonospora sphaerica]GAT65226.1 lipopolysaccharide biosynthesis protein [Planomonospora sphaerica]
MRDTAPARTGLLRRWWPLGAAVLVGTLAGLAFSLVREPVYTADAYVVAVPADRSDTARAVDFAQTYARVATQPEILALALDDASPPPGPDPGLLPRGTSPDTGVPAASVPESSVERLRRAVQASASPDAPLVGLSASAPGPRQAADRANAVATALITYANYQAVNTRVRLVRFTKALPPASPSSPPPAVGAALGATGGVLVGALVCLTVPARSSASCGRPRTAPARPATRKVTVRVRPAEREAALGEVRA